MLYLRAYSQCVLQTAAVFAHAQGEVSVALVHCRHPLLQLGDVRVSLLHKIICQLDQHLHFLLSLLCQTWTLCVWVVCGSIIYAQWQDASFKSSSERITCLKSSCGSMCRALETNMKSKRKRWGEVFASLYLGRHTEFFILFQQFLSFLHRVSWGCVRGEIDLSCLLDPL